MIGMFCIHVYKRVYKHLNGLFLERVEAIIGKQVGA